MTKIGGNPVELAVAAAFYGGQLDVKDVGSFAAKTAADLTARGIDPGAWRDAVKPWSGAEQNVAWRSKASELLKQNRGVLETLAKEIDAIARLPVVAVEKPSAALVEDRMLQLGYSGARRLEPSAIASHSAFLEKGRFAAYPGGLVPPPKMDAGHKRSLAVQIPIDQQLLDRPLGAQLSAAMDRQWGFLHDRGVEDFANPNTLTRYSYNQFAVRQILDNLEARGVRGGRVLLVTGYETPIHELLESDRVKEVVVADLSAHAARMLATKYAHHPQARKLKIEVKDFSGLDPAAQQRALDVLPQVELKPEERLDPQIAGAYFSELTKPGALKAVDYASGSFDAVHLPFVAGSFHLGAATVAASRHKDGHADLEAYFGAENLATQGAQQALERTDKHVFDEARRITKAGGLVVTQIWARPIAGDAAPIRFSDTPLTKKAFDDIVEGYQHRFSGNPQPTLPHTVGHIFTSIAG